MKKRAIRVLAVVGAVSLMMTGLAACKKSVCEWCDEEKRCKVYHLSMLGDKNMCKDCYELVKPISDNLKQLEEMENAQ